MNYKKSLLSLVAVMALSNMAIADSDTKYVPLTSSVVDSAFVLFGVNGFSDGTHGGSSASSVFSTTFTGMIEDLPATDELATNGVYVNAPTNTGPYFMSIQGLNSDSSLSTLKVAIDPAGLVYSENEAVYTMYVKIGGTINVKIDYKSSLDGDPVEILMNGNAYNTILSQENTWSNPAVPSSGLTETVASTTNLRTITDVLDFDFDNNPVTPSDYNTSFRDDTASGFLASTAGAAHFYHYDALKVKWNVWNRHSVPAANEFTKFLKGHSYWGRMDAVEVDGALVNDTGTGHAGLVLGNHDGTVSTDFVDENNVSILAEGWNMLAFNETQPYVRRATTGLIISGLTTNTDQIVITDSTGLYSVTMPGLANAGANIDIDEAVAINKQIESLKLRNLLPANFNVRAFGTATAGDLILISDKKFSVASTAGDAATIDVKTLAGKNPYVDGGIVPVTDLTATSVTASSKVESVYGEYSMLLDVLVGAGTAAELDFTSTGTGAEQSAKVIFGQNGVNNTAVALADDDTTSVNLMSTAITNILADDVFDGTQADGNAILIDMDFDGVANDPNDLVLASSTEPFFVKDATYTRSFDYSGVAGATLKVSGKVALDVATDVVGTLISNINNAADVSASGTSVYAAAGVDADIVVVTTNSDLFDLKDVADVTKDYLVVKSESDDIAKGAVKGVHSLDSIIDVPLGQVTDTITKIANANVGGLDADATYSVTVAGNTAVAAAISTITGITAQVDTEGEMLLLYDAIVAQGNALILANDQHGSLSHDYTTTTPAAALAAQDYTGVITAIGVDITDDLDVTFVVGANGFAATATQGGKSGDNLIAIPTADLVEDLKSNAIYTPNYAVYGPLYTLRNDDGGATGYDVTSILEATTDMDTVPTDTSTAAIEWGGIDMTRNEADWFENNEFDTYRINSTDGYWVRLENKTTNDINISVPTLSASYTNYFSRDGSTTPAYVTSNIINSGSLEVTVTGLSGSDAATVYAIIGAEELVLKNTSGSSSYTATISDYSMKQFSETTSPVSITIRAVDGKGKTKTYTDALMFDYTKPTDVAFTSESNTGAVFTATGGDVSKYYMFSDYIPEYQPDGQELLVSTSGTFDVCQALTFGSTTNLRVVAVDGDGSIGGANISDALGYKYAATLRGAHVITHTQGVDDATKVAGIKYSDTCAVEATYATDDYTNNNGVELTSLVTGEIAKIAFVPIDGEKFERDTAWTSVFQVSGSVEVIQIEATAAYVGDTFYIEYDGTLYSSSFPTQAAAGASISGAPITLTEVDVRNNSL